MDAAKVLAWAGAATAVVGTAGAAVGVIVTWLSHVIEAESKQLSEQVAQVRAALDAEILRNEEARARDKFVLDYNMTVYREVLQLVSEGSRFPCAKQIAITALIDNLRDSPFKVGVARAVKTAGDMCPEVAQTASDTAERTGFDLEQNAVQQVAAVKQQQVLATGAAAGWDYDVFWCEASPGSRSAAEALSSALAEADPNSGRIRVRPLPQSVNHQIGYGVKGFEIRAEAQEREQALKIRPKLSAVISGDIAVRPSTQRTPWYISVFACP